MCVIEIAMFVFGIVTLTKGQFTLSAQKVASGTPAYIIGAILTVILPLVAGIGFVSAIQNPDAAQRNEAGDQFRYLLIDVVAVAVSGITVLLIATIYGRNPSEMAPQSNLINPYSVPAQPQDPNNPYNPPYNR